MKGIHDEFYLWFYHIIVACKKISPQTLGNLKYFYIYFSVSRSLENEFDSLILGYEPIQKAILVGAY